MQIVLVKHFPEMDLNIPNPPLRAEVSIKPPEETREIIDALKKLWPTVVICSMAAKCLETAAIVAVELEVSMLPVPELTDPQNRTKDGVIVGLATSYQELQKKTMSALKHAVETQGKFPRYDCIAVVTHRRNIAAIFAHLNGIEEEEGIGRVMEEHYQEIGKLPTLTYSYGDRTFKFTGFLL